MLNFWQYSFKHPRQNPTRFETEEIEYIMMGAKSYDVYGFAPTQSIQQVVELLIQGTRYNKDLYTNNAVPDVLISLPKLPPAELKRLKRTWNDQYKGKPHQVGFINWLVDKIQKLNESNRDLEWLEGQQWYFKIVFGAYHVSPDEAGFFENSNKSNDEGQEKVTVRNALKPYLQKIETVHTRKTISEILGREDHGLKFKFFPKDHAIEKIEFDQDMQELDRGAMTINEFRKKKGKEPVEWGDDPLRKPFDPASSFTNFGDFGNSGNPGNPGNPPNQANPGNPKPKKEKSLLAKQDTIEAGEEIIEEAKSYSEFLLRFFDSLERKILAAIDSIELDKSYTTKTFGDFMKNLFNSVNTVTFARNVKRFIRYDLLAGLQSAEAELNMDIGFTGSYENKLNQLASQQIDGYLINGKKWPGIKGVTKEIQSDVIKLVQNGINKNLGIDGIKKSISDKFSVFSDWRSEMISRTETNRIINEGKLIGYKESGLDGGKVVKVAIDNRTSPICLRMNQKYGNNPIMLEDSFIDPETNKAYDSPPFHPNCRTTLAFRPK